MRVNPSYLIGHGSFLLGPTAIAAVRDLDDTSLLRRSEITIDGKTLITIDVTTHILTVTKSLFETFLGYEKRESSSPVRTVGAPTTRSTFGSHLQARRVGEAELNNVLYPIGVNISERKSGTEQTKKRKKRELVFFHHQGAHLVL